MKKVPSNKALIKKRHDLFNFYDFSKNFANFLKISKDTAPNTILLNGEYGAGKTTFVNYTKENLKKIKEKYIYLDVWNYGSIKTLQKEFLGFLIKKKLGNKEFNEYNLKINHNIQKRNFSNISIRTFLIFAVIMTMILLTLSYFLLQFNINNKEYFIIEAVMFFLGIFMGNLVLSNYSERDKDFDEIYLSYKKSLNLKNSRIIFIDNIDRLERKNALLFLEHLKIFFADTKDIFVIIGDEKRLDGEGIDKIIDGVYQLPLTDISQNRDFLYKILRKFHVSKIKVHVNILRKSKITSLRKLKRILFEYNIHLSKNNTLNQKEKYILFKLIVLKHVWTNYYYIIKNNFLSKDESKLKGILNTKKTFSERLNEVNKYLVTENNFREKEFSDLSDFLTTSVRIPSEIEILKKLF